MDHTTAVGSDYQTEARAAGAAEVHAQGRVTKPTGDPSSVTKVFVAVHGIGDQFSYATIQSVVNQVCTYYDKPAAIPLGSFHTGDQPFSLVPPYERDPFEQFSFAEVYWAEIPRNLVKDRHKLEETKQWARTLVERLRLRWKQIGKPDRCRDQDFALIGQVLSEMIQTVAVLHRLTFLANRAGLFTFDVKQLLDDFVGDVQIVTEFASERTEILSKFDSVMSRVSKDFPNGKIHVVAHSEGTVVAFLGLLQAFRNPDRPAWAERVRGFMTIGSPIDKHLLLWPTLFAKGNAVADQPAWVPEQPIAWRNYYDYGDPVGFELDDARAWLRSNGWENGNGGVFEFGDEHDVGFSRYPLPGAAHGGYWTDPAVFGHFISTVVNRDDAKNAPPRAKKFQAPPATIRWKQVLAYVLPYVGVAALLAVGAYFLFRSVIGVLHPSDDTGLAADEVTIGFVARNVLGIAALVFGITVAARIPRLTRDLFWRTLALAVGALGAVVYLWCVTGAVALQPRSGYPKGWVVVLLSGLLLGVVYLLGIMRPKWGLVPLVTLGTVAAAGTAGYYIVEAMRKNQETGPFWPLVLAVFGFMYLWWVAALFFDLIFVWHRYIRHSKALAMMDYVLGGEQPPSWGGRARKAMTDKGAPQLQVS